MKRILLPILLMGILLLSACGTSTGETNGIIEVDSNLTATNIEAGMVYGEDFVIDENYQLTFIYTVNCSDIHIEGGTIYYTTTDTSEYTPYFMWVCFPQITKSSRATVIAISEDSTAGDWTVIGVFRKDTDECLQQFGGTYGTQQAGW